MNLDPEDLTALRQAVERLENRGLAIQFADLQGLPVRSLLRRLPQKCLVKIRGAVTWVLETTLEWAICGIDSRSRRKPANLDSQVMVGVSGFIGGFFGLLGALFELPVTTFFLLQSIADRARSEGEDLTDVRARLACLEVFALGGTSEDDEAVQTGYWAIRASLAGAVAHLVECLAKGELQTHHPVMVRLVTAIAGRFGVAIEAKIAAQLIPLIGAFSGASTNVLFMRHFQDMAFGHFTVRRLERRYGESVIRSEYERILGERQQKPGSPAPADESPN